MSVILEHPGICIEVSGTTGYCFGLASTLFREEEFVRFVEGTQAIIKEHMD
jgi:hypothetical protein